MDMFRDEDDSKKELDLNIIRATLTKNGYSFLRPIGQGGFSSVFLIYSNQYNLEFVVKVSDYKGPRKNNLQESFEFDQTEINNLINLNHPNIINMYKYFTDDHYLYIVLEYCEGGSLRDVIIQNGRIRSANLYHYCHQILTALKHCHDLKIAHNDIKPANVLIDKNQRLKLADFGLSKSFSKHVDDHFLGKNGEILVKNFGGSKPYMAPEQINHSAFDPFKADIWSLGVTFYELSTGHLPWQTSDLKQMRLQITVGIFSFEDVKLPSAFCKVIHQMLDVNASKRPSVDWLLKQPIFGQCDAANRASMVNRNSMVSGSIVVGRYRSSDRIRNYGSLTFPEKKNTVTFSEESDPGRLNESTFGEEPSSPLGVIGEEEFEERMEEAVLDKKLAPAPKLIMKRSKKKMRASLPLQKTFS